MRDRRLQIIAGLCVVRNTPKRLWHGVNGLVLQMWQTFLPWQLNARARPQGGR